VVGTIPTELCILGNSLQQLSLADNLLEGGFPECLCSLQNLANFNLAGNQLAGTIPNCVVEAPSLSTLNLASNGMMGTIPPFGVTGLETIDLRNNQLAGRLDGLFVAASQFNPVFAALRLDDNQFTGTIPDLSEVATLTQFTVTGNLLTGAVPLCDAVSVYEQLEVDCFEVECTCCTNC
jgi:LRR receptor-like serine/threonine-protein kinase FLS2